MPLRSVGRKFRRLIYRTYPPRRFIPAAREGFEPELAFNGYRPLAFMHIPKTSGSALMTGLATSLESSCTVNGFDHSLFGSFRDFDTVAVDVRSHIHASAVTFHANAELIFGHFAFSTLRQAYPRARMATVLREPRVRLLSHWLYWRQQTDLMLAPWGKWAEFVRYSREPLASFLNKPRLACQIDNLALRMLLWPHPLIKPDRFIDPIHDERLVMEATARLSQLDFVDFVENSHLIQNLKNYVGTRFDYARVNETNNMPAELRAPLHREFSPEACELLRARSRLDIRLWTAIAKLRLPDHDINAIREQAMLASVARYGALMRAD